MLSPLGTGTKLVRVGGQLVCVAHERSDDHVAAVVSHWLPSQTVSPLHRLSRRRVGDLVSNSSGVHLRWLWHSRFEVAVGAVASHSLCWSHRSSGAHVLSTVGERGDVSYSAAPCCCWRASHTTLSRQSVSATFDAGATCVWVASHVVGPIPPCGRGGPPKCN